MLADFTVTVIYPYDGKGKDDLAMKPGDVITVETWNVSDDWAKGTLNSKTGLFYKAFVKPSAEFPSPDDLKLKEVRGKPKGYEATYQGREYILKKKLGEVECIICQEIAHSVHQTSCCGYTICLDCARKWKMKNNSCPHCRNAPFQVMPDPKTRREIVGATVLCPNYTFGCDFVDVFGCVLKHIETSCRFELKNCPNSHCGQKFPSQILKFHCEELCPQRELVCPCCNTDAIKVDEFTAKTWLQAKHALTGSMALTYFLLINVHSLKCPLWPTQCPNSCDPYLTLTRSTVDSHVKEVCPETCIDCKFSVVGCGAQVRRKEMNGHLRYDVSQHMSALLEDYMKLKEENDKLKREVAKCNERLSSFTKL